MPSSAKKATRSLTTAQKQFWNENGYLILSSFFEPAEVEAVNAVVDRRIQDPASFGNATIDVLTGPYIGKRFRAAEAPPEAFQGPIKINDLFLDEPEVRNLALNDRLTQVLAELLGDVPLVCNSLNFLWGSQQPAHFDTWYMPSPARQTKISRLGRWLPRPQREEPPRQDHLAVSSICLEDVHPDAGPLVYYPGTHKIEPYRFSHGGIHAIEAEMPACRAYLEQQLSQRKIEKKEFLGKAGDVFVWHGQLLHGGSQIHDPARTRKTLVTHYWRVRDVEPERAVKVHRTGYYEKRAHQLQ